MGLSFPTLPIAEKYTKDTAAGMGAVKGAACQIQSVTSDNGIHTVTFKWEDNNGGTHTQSAVIKDGVSPSATVRRNTQDDGIIIEVTDKTGTTRANVYDGSVASSLSYPTQITEHPSINGRELVGNRTTAELGINIPTKNSQLTNDSGFITASDIPTVDASLSQVSENAVSNKAVTTEIRTTQETVNDLVTEVGQNTSALDILNGAATVSGSVKQQIQDAIANIDKLTKRVVDTLPAPIEAEDNVIYMIENPDGEGYLQYMLVEDDDGQKALASLGGTNIDLTGYYTKTETDDLLAEKQATITGAATTITTMNMTANRALVSNSNGKVGISAVKTTELEALSGVTDNIQQQINGKADDFTADTTPTQNSTNPITSGGVYTALADKQGTLTFDNAPAAESLNPVTSGGIKTALDNKQDSLTFDDRPKENSDNVLSSGVVYDNLNDLLDSAKAYTDAKISDFGGFALAASLDDIETPNTKTIYLIKDDEATGDDKYKEYIYIVENNVGRFIQTGDTSFTLTTATLTALGVVKPDGTTITIDDDGTIHGANTLEAGAGIDITDDVVSTTQLEFIGTNDEWDSLTEDEKKQYTTALITDDEDGTDVKPTTVSYALNNIAITTSLQSLKSVTIPANCIFGFMFEVWNNNVAQYYLRVDNDVQGSANAETYVVSNGNSTSSSSNSDTASGVSGTGFTTSERTLYFRVKTTASVSDAKINNARIELWYKSI